MNLVELVEQANARVRVYERGRLVGSYEVRYEAGAWYCRPCALGLINEWREKLAEAETAQDGVFP